MPPRGATSGRRSCIDGRCNSASMPVPRTAPSTTSGVSGGSRTSGASTGARCGITSTRCPTWAIRRSRRSRASPRWRRSRRPRATSGSAVSCSASATATRECCSKAAVTIDHLSGGRCELGIGAGWNENEFRAFGMPFAADQGPPRSPRGDGDGPAAPVRRRARHVPRQEGAPGRRPLRAAARAGATATVDRRPGEKRLLRMVARHADGWNVPFLSPEFYAMRNATLNDWCEKERRDPRAIVRTCNVGLAIGADEARARQQEEKLQLMFGALTDFVRPGHPHRHPGAGARSHRRVRSAPAPSGSSWRCARPSTGTASTSSSTRSCLRSADPVSARRLHT